MQSLDVSFLSFVRLRNIGNLAIMPNFYDMYKNFILNFIHILLIFYSYCGKKTLCKVFRITPNG